MTARDERTAPQTFDWANHGVGTLDPDWHHLVGYELENPLAKLLHYTMGIPEFPEVHGHGYEREWQEEKKLALRSPSWFALMGHSIHAEKVLEKFE